MPNILPLSGAPSIHPETDRLDALVCRPLWGGRVTTELVERVARPGGAFVIATLSSGSDHIDTNVQQTAVVINAKNGENAAATAELCVTKAISIRRHMLACVFGAACGAMVRPATGSARSLVGADWLILGFGHVGACVLDRLLGFDLASIVVVDRSHDVETTWSRLFARSSFAHVPASARETSVSKGSLEVSGTQIFVLGDLDHGASLLAESTYPVVSVHEKVAAGGLGSEELGLFSDALFVNMARHDVVDESAAIAAISSGALASFATDVLNPVGEDSALGPVFTTVGREFAASTFASAPNSPLENLAGAIRVAGGEFRGLTALSAPLPAGTLALTPHLGGFTVDAEHAVGTYVVTELLRHLEVSD